jgi:hypothetical protein
MLASCASLPKSEYEYYYYSHTAYQLKQSAIDGGASPKPNHSTIDGKEFTCNCPPSFIEKEYRPNFPDVVLVKKLKKGQGKVLIHF